MKVLLLTITLLFSPTLFSQNIKAIRITMSAKICDCVGRPEKYANLRPKLKSCHEKVMSEILQSATRQELLALGNADSLLLLNRALETDIKAHCENVKNLIAAEIKNSTVQASKIKGTAYPLNFSAKELPDAKAWEGKIVAFECTIIRVEKSRQNTPYYETGLDDATLWIVSMPGNTFEPGKRIRALGYLTAIDANENAPEKKLHKQNYHVLAFAFIDVETGSIINYPGSEVQIKEWAAGKIPSGGK